MSHWCYILYSRELDRFYIGETGDLDERLRQHKEGFFKQSFTKRATDWENYFSVECNDRVHARRIEAQIKRMKSRRFMINLRENLDMQERLRTGTF
jgi:putative endonuclease